MGQIRYQSVRMNSLPLIQSMSFQDEIERLGSGNTLVNQELSVSFWLNCGLNAVQRDFSVNREEGARTANTISGICHLDSYDLHILTAGSVQTFVAGCLTCNILSLHLSITKFWLETCHNTCGVDSLSEHSCDPVSIPRASESWLLFISNENQVTAISPG